MSATKITLDGRRSYRVHRDLQCFSTLDLSTVPLLQRKGQYVQLGARGGVAGWVAVVAGVVPSTPPAVYYTGVLERTDGRVAVFRDGTVLELAPDVKPPAPGRIVAKIDPGRRAVVELRSP